MSAFTGVVQGQPLYEPYEVVIPVGTTQETPVGPITVTLDNPEQHFPYHIDQAYTEIPITYSSLVDTRVEYDKNMEVTMKEGDIPLSSVMRVELPSSHSEPVSYTHLDVYKRQHNHFAKGERADTPDHCSCRPA